MSMLDIALSCIARGWYVFPCWPKTKKPMTKNGFKDATNDEAQVREWWTPNGSKDANVAIATGPSGLCVVDVDHGFNDLPSLWAWLDVNKMPLTYAVRTGRRPEFGVQLYYSGEGLKSTGWRDDVLAISGDIRCSTGYVMAAGSIHPSGEPYTIVNWGGCNSVPDYVRTLTTKASEFDPATAVDDFTADTWKMWLLQNVELFCKSLVLNGYEKRVANGWWLGVECPWLSEHTSGKGVDSSTVIGVLDGKLAFECSHGTCKAQKRNTATLRHWLAVNDEYFGPEPGAEPEILLGKPKEPPADWRDKYMTLEAFQNVKEPVYLIKGFLVKGSIVMLGGPVAQRKSIIALNAAHSLCSGEPLFGYFDVSEKPSRVIYLCPEMGPASFVKRIKSIGLGDYVGKTLFIQTMADKPSKLDDLVADELDGAVVIVDTIVRFVEGDENKSEDMRKFAAKVFRLVSAGATVILLHHSKKGSAGNLDDGLRGSSELAAFVDSCWVTELDDPSKPYTSQSKVRNVKQRDFECDPFRLDAKPDSYALTMADGGPAPDAVIKDKKEEAARVALLELIGANPTWGINKLREELSKLGHRKGQKFVTKVKADASGSGCHTESE